MSWINMCLNIFKFYTESKTVFYLSHVVKKFSAKVKNHVA